MAVPWLAAIGVEYAVFGRFFASDLNARDLYAATATAQAAHRADPERDSGLPVFTIIVVALTLAGFAGASAAGVNPAWAAFAGAARLWRPARWPAAGWLLSPWHVPLTCPSCYSC